MMSHQVVIIREFPEVFLSVFEQGCYLDVKLPLEYRSTLEIFIRPDGIVNYESLCGISAKVHYVILVVL